jgi:NTE family protein
MHVRVLLFAFCLTLLLPLAARAQSTNHPPRPKVGIALGGGGALGFAHIGVLRALEEQKIPVDFIAGTSMGAIIAGYYAAGLSPDEMERALLGLDWWDILKDKPPRRELDFRRKQEELRYLFDQELGLRVWRLLVPSALSSGQKLNNELQIVTRNAAGITDFDRFNIPYRAVATDIRTGETVVLDRGNLATAMRASMAVPGVFTPVMLDDRLLVDGGIVNNVPVDVVRGMGADVVIAVDLSAVSAQQTARGKLDSLAEIVGRTYAILQRNAQAHILTKASVVITPDLTAFGGAEFHRGADIIPRGYAAAQQASNQLALFRVPDAEMAGCLERQRRRRSAELRITSIGISGMHRVAEEALRARISTQPGETADFTRIRHDLGRIFGLGDFVTANYTLQSEGDGARLVYNVQEKPWGPDYLHLGLQLLYETGTEATWGFLLNNTLRPLNNAGGELLLDVEVGTRRALRGEWWQPLHPGGKVFSYVSALGSLDRTFVYQAKNLAATYDVDEAYADAGCGLNLGSYGEARLGARFGKAQADFTGGSDATNTTADTVAKLRASLTLDRRDRAIFTRSGWWFAVHDDFGLGDWFGDTPANTLTLGGAGWVSHAAHTFGLSLEGGTGFGDTLPLYDQFAIGGVTSLVGFYPGELRGDRYAVGRLSYFYELTRLPPSLGRGVYLAMHGDVGNAWTQSTPMTTESLHAGVGAALAADSVLGPTYIGAGLGDTGRIIMFLGLGNRF